MRDQESHKIPADEPYPNTTTRSELLRKALEAGTSPQPPREFSTLVERLEPVDMAPGCADPRNCVVHGGQSADAPVEAVWPPEVLDELLARLAQLRLQR